LRHFHASAEADLVVKVGDGSKAVAKAKGLDDEVAAIKDQRYALTIQYLSEFDVDSLSLRLVCS